MKPIEPAPSDNTARWNEEWLAYLSREFEVQLAPHTDYPNKPDLPEDPSAMAAVELRSGERLDIYCDGSSITNRRLLEVGCGCGYFGKQIARYAEHYLGVDHSTLALKIARLVSPSNCTYVHIRDDAALAPFFGTVDMAIGRHFWIHQNMESAQSVLRFILPLLRPSGRISADFYWPNPEKEQGLVLRPTDALAREYPSATFQYAKSDVEALIAGTPLRIIREHIDPRLQRRFVILEKSP
jgi:SAM-dependent methyltransferase